MHEVAHSPLIVRDLTFRYQKREEHALRSVSFSLEAGQVLLVAGASGCGKTTLVRCINGLIPHSYKGELEGEILLYRESISGQPLSVLSQTVGTLLQDPERQILGAHVRNEVSFGLENLGLPRAEIISRVEDTLAYMGIAHLADRETFYLSGGEKQKVALAGVLAMQPSILLLDEPLASLDPASAVEALDMVRGMADEGKTIIIIEHRVEDVLRISPDLVMFMSQGDVRSFGPPESLAAAVDYHEVKLPAGMIMAMAREDPPIPDVVAGRPPPTVDGAPLVSFEQVGFSYADGPPVLQDVSLSVYPNEVVAILGPNGAGKTTLMKHTIGLLKPTRGRVLVKGNDTKQMTVAQLAQSLGYVFQSPSHMLFAPTVALELAFGPRNLRQDQEAIADAVSQSVQIMNLSGLESFSPLSLSFGQQKRVTIASVLAMGSEILVMDEPTAGQDYSNYMAFMESILGLSSFRAILFITHDLDLALCYANRIILLSDGSVAADGPPNVVLRDEGLLERCRVIPTSLLSANQERESVTGRYMRAELLGHVDWPGRA